MENSQRLSEGKRTSILKEFEYRSKRIRRILRSQNSPSIPHLNMIENL